MPARLPRSKASGDPLPAIRRRRHGPAASQAGPFSPFPLFPQGGSTPVPAHRTVHGSLPSTGGKVGHERVAVVDSGHKGIVPFSRGKTKTLGTGSPDDICIPQSCGLNYLQLFRTMPLSVNSERLARGASVLIPGRFEIRAPPAWPRVIAGIDQIIRNHGERTPATHRKARQPSSGASRRSRLSKAQLR